MPSRLRWTLAALTSLSAAPTWAQPYPAMVSARVLSATPVTQTVATTAQHCHDELVQRAPAGTSGVGAMLGAFIGGALGHAWYGASMPARPPAHHGYGHRHGPRPLHPDHGAAMYRQSAGTLLGAVTGGWLGHHIERQQASSPTYDTLRRCLPTTAYAQQTVGYDVIYVHAGQHYRARLAHDPGPWLALAVPPLTPGHAAPPAAPVVHATERRAQALDSTRFYGPSGAYHPAPAGTVILHSSSSPAD